MTPPFDSYQQAIGHCQQAYRQRDFRAARRWAEQAAALKPDHEDGWLWLAAVASPRASVAYLKRALEINPASERARKAMHWAIRRMRQEPPQPPARLPALRRVLVAAPIPSHEWVKRRPLLNRTSLAWIVLLLCLVMLFLAGAAPFVQAAFAEGQAISLAQGIFSKPTRTPTPTATLPPTATFTATPLPTDTPVPTEPPPTEAPPPVDASGQPLPSGIEDGQHWIDINLTDQSAFAYNGSELVKSFIVSTGMWQTPTVTGQYNIYVKYRYADMAGPGYYLPNVPYVMYFYEGYGLHGTYWHNNFGTPMSHGCVNFSTDDAGWVFDFVEVGTLVNIHY
jgi:lipoprotein-anchoring transpeptidase ErfK/SrfK